MFPPWTTYPVTIFRCTLSRFCEDTRIGAGSRGHALLDWFTVKFEFQSSAEYKNVWPPHSARSKYSSQQWGRPITKEVTDQKQNAELLSGIAR